MATPQGRRPSASDTAPSYADLLRLARLFGVSTGDEDDDGDEEDEDEDEEGDGDGLFSWDYSDDRHGDGGDGEGDEGEDDEVHYDFD